MHWELRRRNPYEVGSRARNGNAVKECLGAPCGKTGLQYGQLKKAAPHPLPGGYGLPAVRAAHGPDGVAPLCAD